MRPTLQTVADAVGVSRSTVSNAYSNPDQLSAELREKIFEVARKIGYPGPNPAARSLRRGRAGAIGVLFTDSLPYAFTDPYAVQYLRGVSEAAERYDSGLLLVPLAGDEKAGIHAVQNAAVDGFCIYCVPEWHWATDAIRSRGLPIVTSEQHDDDRPDVLYVGIDERGAARAAAAHLVALGHRQVAFLSDYVVPERITAPVHIASPEEVRYYTAGERLRGFRDAFAEAGVAWADITVLSAAANSREDGARAAAYALDRADRPTAILAVTDLLALGVLDALAVRGLRPGRDVSVTGFDDIPEAGAAGLTTIRQDPIERGRRSGELLLDPPDDPASRRVLLPTELVVRASTGPAPHGWS
ncbi:MAG: LacI family DNA-binding transcriptional regulator [Micromonosporaceae bacterium]|nr:LacI family DNA-binding transcriptional regulator [Micromonosporaceae bacterium]